MPAIETSINDIANPRTEYPAFIEAATYLAKDGKEHSYKEILDSFDSPTRLGTRLEKDAFYTDWKRTAAQMYNVITDPEIDRLGGAITQDQFIQMAFEELLQRNKITLEAGWFGINTRYESMSPNDQLDLIVSLVNKYTEKEENNLSDENKLAINERLNNAEQTIKGVSQEDPNNPVNLAKRINTTDPTDENYFVFVSEEAKEKHISSAIKYFKEQGYSDEDIDMYRSIMEEIGVNPTAEIENTIQINNEERYNELAKELYGVENYEDLTPKQFEQIKNPTKSINELAENIRKEYYIENLPAEYNYSFERFMTNPEDLDSIKMMRAYQAAEKKTPFNIAKEWWKEQGVSIDNFKAISKYLYNNNISLIGTFRELNYDPVAFAFQQQGLQLPNMELSLKERVKNSLLDKD